MAYQYHFIHKPVSIPGDFCDKRDTNPDHLAHLIRDHSQFSSVKEAHSIASLFDPGTNGTALMLDACVVEAEVLVKFDLFGGKDK